MYFLCILEFQDNCCFYDWVIENIFIDCMLRQYEFLCFNLEYMVLSKCCFIQLVDENYVYGWDDFCMFIIVGLCCCGYILGLIVEFCKCIGVIKMDNMVEMFMLEVCICDDLNVNVFCVMVVLDLIKFVIENYEEGQIEMFVVLNYFNDESMGMCNIGFSCEVYIEVEDF